MRAAFRGARISITRDLFTEGPCPVIDTTEVRQWLTRRIEWWARRSPANRDAIKAGYAAIDEFERARVEVEEAVVWAADSLSEQLHACWLAAVLPDGVAIRHARTRHSRMRFVGVGHLGPGPLAATESRVVPATERARAAALWRAFSEATPTQFLALAVAIRKGLIADELSRISGRFPDRRHGLTRWEHSLMSRLMSHAGEPSARTVGHVLVCGADEHPDFMRDSVLFCRLRELAASGLLTQSGDGLELRSTHFQITPLGRRVLAGEANRVEVAGFDRWLGGTHLSSACGTVWFRDGDTVTAGPSA